MTGADPASLRSTRSRKMQQLISTPSPLVIATTTGSGAVVMMAPGSAGLSTIVEESLIGLLARDNDCARPHPPASNLC
jgi:hypothetical protein